MTASLRALLALTLLAGVYLLTGLLVLLWIGFAVGAVWVVGSREASPQFNTVPLLVASATFVPLALTVRELVRVSRPAGPRPDSVLLTRGQGAALWDLVETLAERVGTDPPLEIRLTGEANAAVTDDAWLLAPTGRRRLYVGVPLLVGLRPDELRAVLAHELGHYARRHARFTEPAHRAYAGMVMGRQRIREAMVANHLVRLYAGPLRLTVTACAALTYRLVRPVRRRQELEADRIAAEVAGAGALADGLRSVPAVAAAWARFEADLVGPVRHATGTVPDEPHRAFAHLLVDPEFPPELAALRRAAERLPADGFHPAMRRRLDRLAGLPDDPRLPPAPEVAATLAPGPLRRATRYAGRRRPWREWLETLAAYRAGVAVEAVTAVLHPDPGPSTVAEVLRRVGSGRADRIARALGPDPQVGRRRLVEGVSALVGLCLLRAGRVRVTVGWTGYGRFTGPAVDHDDITDWVTAALDEPDGVPRLLAELTALGADPDDQAGAEPAGAARTLTITPALDETTRRRHQDVAYVSLAVLLLLALLGFAHWLGDEPETPYRPGVTLTRPALPDLLDQGPLPGLDPVPGLPLRPTRIVPSWSPPPLPDLVPRSTAGG
ncbi:Zn-dependent protease with chaperone function [Micromonospora echinospora]|uniref:Zn-dependent protease with chaperone function n=1 Tax=Micromonospora echinospora TaxID=1877 RepID=A0A1C4ZVW1_MICEC|nr:M48 family metallopeptidase [Micromonospora echinospora]SCF37083.1 Zn-dependent protease with chaperone function [Micromonospora echinospora]